MGISLSKILLFTVFTALMPLHTEAGESRPEHNFFRAPAWMKVSTADRVDCFPPRLMNLLQKISLHFRRPITVLSGFRDREDNARRDGAKNSAHLRCNAADIEVPGYSAPEVAAYASKMPGMGGVGFYCNNRVHVDIEKRRNWGPCL